MICLFVHVFCTGACLSDDGDGLARACLWTCGAYLPYGFGGGISNGIITQLQRGLIGIPPKKHCKIDGVAPYQEGPGDVT